MAFKGRNPARSRHAARGLDQVVCLDDLLRALFGVLEHGLGQTIRFQLVGMMLAELTPVRLRDVGVGRLRIDLEYLIRGLQLHAVPGRPARPAAGTGSGALAEMVAAETQYLLDVHELDGRDLEQRRDPLDREPRRTSHVDALERRAHLEFEEYAQQIRVLGARGREVADRRFHVEVGVLAVREVPDRGVDLRATQAQLRHDPARGGDLGFGHATVGLRDVAHDGERGREELVADFLQRRAMSATRADRLVDEVAEHGADDGAPEAAQQQITQNRADDLSGPAHRTGLLIFMPNMLHGTTPPVHTTALGGLKKIHTGKVRDIYEIDARSMLIVTTDRLSAFDVVLPDPIPDKGRVLNSISNFWFARTTHIVPNHLTGRRIEEVVSDPAERATLADRAVIVKRLKTVPLEAVVRGYVIGSGWKDYQKTGSISGIKLPAGLKQAARLPQTLFTPSTKAAIGDKDETISFEQAAQIV